MAECKKNVGRGIIAYPCVVQADHDGPCMANENGPSIHARKAWLSAVELEALETVPDPSQPGVGGSERRVAPHPNAEPLSAFQGPARTSATGLMEHVEEGIAGPTPLSTIDTNAPGQGRTLGASRPRTIWAGEPVEVSQESDSYEAPVVTQPTQVVDFPSVTFPTKTREGDQPLPEVREGGGFIQDLVIEDIEARKQVGISRYGTPLQSFNGRNVDQDLYEELIDATTYLRQRLVERQALNDAVTNVARLIDGADVPAEVWVYLNVLFDGTNG
jgi:hypothetical protein